MRSLAIPAHSLAENPALSVLAVMISYRRADSGLSIWKRSYWQASQSLLVWV